MLRPIVWIFLLLSSLFMLTHLFAMYASLYWYYSWFDIVMHFSGGVLIGVGLHALGTFSRIKKRPNRLVVFGVALLFVIVWEIFEWFAGLYDPATHLIDTLHDIFNGLAGAFLAHEIIKKFKI